MGAQRGIVDALRADLTAPRHPSDGGGRAWLEPDPRARPVRVGEPSQFDIRFEAGPLGVVEGGMIFLQVSPFWGWSTPQTQEPELAGYTQVSTEAKGVVLEPETVDRQLLGIRVSGRALVQGERVRIEYAATADRYAERESPFWIAVDGDGDGVRGLVPDSPQVDVAAGPPAQLVLSLSATARPGGAVRLTVAVLDALGSAGVDFEGTLGLEVPEGLELPGTLRLGLEDLGRATISGRATESGTFRVRATWDGGPEAISNPLRVAADVERVLWADLHGHSQLSDGTGTPEDYLSYARDVAGLDVAALTDHDHWGMQALSQYPELWQRITTATHAVHVPERFVTLLAYEWTNWIHGHRHVLYFGEDGAVLSSVDAAFEHPRQLWAALRGQPAMTIAHHSAGGPIATNWSIPPDPILEPVTEIVSVHGSSEAADSPGVIYSPIPGNYVRDALAHGYLLGFLGSGDSHDGHPGLAHLASPSSGLAAILSETLDRPAILSALRARRVYATNGPRILLRVQLGGRSMGSVLAPGDLGPEPELRVSVDAQAPLERVDVVRTGRVLLTEPLSGLSAAEAWTLDPLAAGDYVYVRVIQEDGGAAWSSPIFVR